MEKLESFIVDKMKYISKQQKVIFFSILIAGLISHGYVLTNKFSYHDDIIMLDGLGSTFVLGRWFLGILDVVGRKTIGAYSVPLFQGLLSFLFIAFSGMLMVDILKIKSKMSAVYMGSVLVAFPVVTSVFAYMFTSGVYWGGLLLNTLSVYLMSRKQSIKNLSISILLISLGLGIYQAFFAVAVTLFMLSLVLDIMENMEEPSKDILYKGIWYLVTLSGGIAIYFILNTLILTFTKIQMVSYQGIDRMGKIDFAKVPSMLNDAYYNFFVDVEWGGINNSTFVRCVIITIFLISICLVLGILFQCRGSIANKLLFLVLVLFFPLGVNIVYVMSSSDSYSVHTLMKYSLAISLFFPIILLEHLNLVSLWKRWETSFKNIIAYVLPILLWMLVIVYMYNDNIAYLKAGFLQEQTISYYTTLISQIRSAEGYRDELSVAYIGERCVEDLNLATMPYFDNIKIDGFNQDLSTMINDYTVRAYMERHCGYSPTVVADVEVLKEMQEVKEMPCYPDNGSIKVINNIVVVKFSE